MLIIGLWYVTGHTTCLVNKFQNLLFAYCVALNDVLLEIPQTLYIDSFD